MDVALDGIVHWDCLLLVTEGDTVRLVTYRP